MTTATQTEKTLAEARSELAVWRKRWQSAVKYGRQQTQAGREIAEQVKFWAGKVAFLTPAK